MAPQQKPATNQPVSEHPPEQREKHDRQLLQKGVETKVERRPRQREDEPVFRNVLHPGTDAGSTRAHPEDPEIAVVERSQCATHNIDPNRGRSYDGGIKLYGIIQSASWTSPKEIAQTSRLPHAYARPAQ